MQNKITGFILLLGIILFSSLAYAENQFVTVKELDGYVEIMRASETNWQPAAVGTQLFSNDKIRTRLESRAVLEYPDATTLSLRENTQLAIQDISRDPKTGLTKRELKLNVGGMKYKVTKLAEKGSDFKIHSSTAIVGVTGTEGIINSEGDNKPTQNTLLEGTTYNTDETGQNGRPLNAGNSWMIDENAKSDKHTITEEEKAENEYKEKDKTLLERFNKFAAAINQKKIDGYIADERVLEEITQAMLSRDYPKAQALLNEAEKSLENLKKPLDAKANEASVAIKALQNELQEKEKQGYDLAETYLLYNKLLSLYQEKNYAGCSDLIEQIRHKLLSLVKSEINFLQLLNQLTDEIARKAKAGFMVEEAIALAKRAELAYQNNARAKAEELLQKAAVALTQAKQEIPPELLTGLQALKEAIAVKKNEGYATTSQEELFAQAEKLLEDKNYIEAKTLLEKIKAELELLKKVIPEDLMLSLKNFEELLKKKETNGFDLSKLQDALKSIYEAKEKGDFEKLRTLLTETIAALTKLAPPEGLLLRLKEFREKLKEKAAYATSQLENLNNQIQAALEKEDLAQVRLLLDNAEELLNALKDTEPPKLQVSDLAYKDNLVIVSGMAQDNIKLEYVSVNGALTPADTSGHFSAELLLTPLLKEILVEAEDAQGNRAPQITVAIPEEKIPKASSETPALPPELNAQDIKLTYTDSGLLVSGKTAPAAILTVNGQNVTASASGEFSLAIAGSEDLVKNGLTINELKLAVEDKWLPQISHVQGHLFDNMPPALKVDNLNYGQNNITVKGNCVDTANIVIEGEAPDIGSGIKEILVNGEPALVEKSKFKHTLLLKPELKIIEIKAIDASGNTASSSRPVDLFAAPAEVKINELPANLDNNGDFVTEINLTPELKEVIVQAKDHLGNTATPVKLIVADRLPPQIILGDIFYQPDSVSISGQTEAYALVYDKSTLLFPEKISADANGLFKINANRPKNALTAKLVSEDTSGNISGETELTIEPAKDEKPPLLTVANLNFKDNKVIVSGSAEDDTGIKSVTVNDEKVELVNGVFSKELAISVELVKIIVVATDLSDKTTTVEKIISDTQKPEINLEELVYEKGYCLVKGTAKDNLGLKEVRINNVPIAIKLPEGGDFQYQFPIIGGLKEVVAGAVDLYGNYQEALPKTITLPDDKVAPNLTLNALTYGSPKVTVSGLVSDNTGLKAVLINDQPVDFYEDGTFKVTLDIKVGPPTIILNDAIYEQGYVLVSGSVTPAAQEPSEITAFAEDLSGNKSMLLKNKINALDLNKFKVLVNDEPAVLENGAFRTNVLLKKGLSGINVQAYDSLGNASEEISLPLEKAPPILALDELVYGENTITISGTATDNGSGLAEVLINNAPVSFGSDGKFSKTLTIAESIITVMALDRLGNAAASAPIKVSPPDKSGPLFILKVTPVPAIIGKDVSIAVDVLDSKTRMPEILDSAPIVFALLSNNETKTIAMEGSGASFYGKLTTNELPAGLISLTVEGTDKAGNKGQKTEGTTSFLLNTTDTTPPSFTITLTPAAPVISGKELKVNIIASETLKSPPKATVTLPDGVSFEFTEKISIPVNIPPGNAAIQLSEAVDLAGNKQTTPLIYNFLIETEKAKAGVPLRIEFSEITPDRILIKGLTAAKAIVRLSIADIKADLSSDDNGQFAFIREISAQDLERWRRAAPSVLFNCYATNYAGLISEKINFNIPLPAAGAGLAAGNFSLDIKPYPLEQGKSAQLDITSSAALKEAPKVNIRLGDGKIETINISGAGKEFKGTYQSSAATAIGAAIIEIKGDNLFETKPYRIVPSAENYAFMAGAGFFSLSVNPDPLPQGKELDITVYAQRLIPKTPTLNIRLPNGKIDNIVLSGSGTEFKGKYLCAKDTPVGPAELIVNMSERNELRRPFGIAPPGGMRFGEFIRSADIIAFSNPMPMSAGSPATITVKSAKNLEEAPLADLRLSNGKIIPLNLSGASPGNNFSGQLNLPQDASFGPASIVIRNKQGQTLGEYPTGIAPSFAAGPAELMVTMAPSPATPGQTASININTGRRQLNAMPSARLIFNNGMILPLVLEGNLPGNVFRVSAMIPATASPGPVGIMVADQTGTPLGGGKGYIGGGGARGGEVRISLMPPHPTPGQFLEVNLSAADSLRYLPKVILHLPEKGPKDLRVEGAVPGNNFKAGLTFPADAKVSGAKIEARFDRGSGEETQTLYLEGAGHEETGMRPPKLTPYPPIPGQPLIITLYAPAMVNFLPAVRVNYVSTTSEPVTMSGALPGDTFTGTLAKVNMPIKSVDVLDNTGKLIVTLPIEMFGGMGTMMGGPQIEVMPMPLMPGLPANLNVNFPMPVFSLPTASIKLNDGRSIPIILNGGLPGNRFFGMFNLPSGTPVGQAMLEVYLDNQLIPGGRMPVSIGTETGTMTGDMLGLMAYPGGPGELILDWQLNLADAVKYRIAYEASGIARKTIDLGRLGHYAITGLKTDLDYNVVLIALDINGKELSRSQRIARLPSAMRTGFPLYVNPAGPGNLQINWDYQANAINYELRYGKDVDPKTQPAKQLGNVTGYFLSGLAPGNYRFIVEAVFSNGERTSSYEVPASVGGTFDFGRPPIEVFPNPPIIGQPLNINAMLPMPIPALPKITAKYLTQGEEPFAVTGTVPGNSFRGNIASAKDQVTAINFYDPMTGELKYSHPLTSVFIGGIPTDLRVKITVSPEPPVAGSNLNINLDFNQSIDFYKLNLHAYAELVDGRRIDLAVTGAAPAMNYKTILPASQHTSAVRLIGVEGSGIIPEEYINTQLTGGKKAVITLMPDPPQTATYTQIKANIIDAATNQLSSLTAYPAIMAEFDNGERRTLPVSGALPGSEFSASIQATTFLSSLKLIDVLDSNGGLLGSRSFAIPGTTQWAPPPSPFTPDPPAIGQPLSVIMDIPANEPALTMLPKIKINYAAGVSPQNEYMNVTGTLPGRNFTGNLASVKGPITSAEFIDPLSNAVVYTHTFGNMAMVTGGDIEIIPFPPILGQALTINYKPPAMLSSLPYLRIQFLDGTGQEFLTTGATPGSNFSYSIGQLLKTPQHVEFWDNARLTKLAEKHLDPAVSLSGWVLTTDPAPPQFGQTLTVTLTNVNQSMLDKFPWLKLIFSDSAPEYLMAGTLPGSTFNYVVSALSKLPQRVEVWDNAKTTKLFELSPNSTMPYPVNLWDEASGISTERKIHWDPLPGVPGYDIYLGLSDPPSTKWKEVLANVGAEIVSGLTTGQTYYYFVLVRGAPSSSPHAPVKSFVAGGGGSSGTGNLQITAPTGQTAAFNNTNAGSTTNTITVTVKNSGNLESTAKAIKRPLMNGTNTIPIANINFVDGFIVPGGGASVSQNIYVTIPSGTTAGTYGSTLTIYDDANKDSTQNSEESYATLTLTVTVGNAQLGTVSGLRAVNQGTAGTVDLNWSDSATGNHYHIYYNTSSTQSYGTPQLTIANTSMQVTGLATNQTYYFAVRGSSGSTHTAGDSEDTNNTVVSAYSSADTLPPTFAGIKRAYATGVTGQVQIEFNSASDATTPITYFVYYSNTQAGVFSATPINIGALTSYTVTGLTDGTTYYFGVRARDNALNTNTNTTTETATPYANVTNIVISSATSGVVGTPVLVKLTASNSGFSDAVKINVTENTPAGSQPRYLISSQDRVTRDTAEVAMTNGVGYFTIDAIESTTVSITTAGIASNAQTITFTGLAGSTPTQIAVDCDTAAKIGAGPADGVLVWISAVDGTGKIVTNYTGTITITGLGSATIAPTPAKGANTVAGNQYTYATGDNGEVILRIQDNTPESINIVVSGTGSPPPANSPSKSITFSGVQKYLIESGGQYTINATTTGNRIKFTAYAATNTGTKLSGYNGTATWNRVSETTSNNSSQAIPSSISFTDGQAEFHVEDSEYETVEFNIADGAISSGTITANFASADPTPPDIRSAVAETPFLIHLYFTEEIDSTNALKTTNYTGVGTINKVCWYGNEVTVHLAAQLALGSSSSITVNGISPDGIKDTNGNFMGTKTPGFTVPNVDYQGTANSGTDWLEIQVSPSSVPTGSNQNVTVIVRHKNACGYLSGSNAVNRSSNVSTVNFTYGGAGTIVSGGNASRTMSDGTIEFTLTINLTAGQTVTAQASATGVTNSGTATISAQ